MVKFSGIILKTFPFFLFLSSETNYAMQTYFHLLYLLTEWTISQQA